MGCEAFSRRRILGFVDLLMSQICLLTRSLSVQISAYVQEWTFHGDCSKQAYSQARQKIRHEAFIALNQCLCTEFYRDTQLSTYQHYVLLAVDGSLLQVPESQALLSHFGLASNAPAGQKSHSMPMARTSVVYDVCNQLVVDATLAAYTASEQSLFAQQHLPSLRKWKADHTHPVLLLADRNYASQAMFVSLLEAGIEFVIRLRSGFNRHLTQMLACGQSQTLVATASIRYRLVAIDLPNAAKEPIREYLATSLLDAPLSSLKELYCLRWGIETHYNFQKNYLQIENFSSRLLEGIYQDYHAKILASNLRALLVKEAQEERRQEEQTKSLKYDYQINQAVALGLVRERVPALLWAQDWQKEWQGLKRKIKRRLNPIKPGRSFPRKKKLHYTFPINQRTVT